jgi:hypothetical protein
MYIPSTPIIGPRSDRQAIALLQTRIYNMLLLPALDTPYNWNAHIAQVSLIHFTLCREQRAPCLPANLPANLDVASACDADVPAAASMIAITPQP